MLRKLLASCPAPCIRSGPVAGSAVAHAVVVTMVLMTTRGTDSHSHGWNDTRLVMPPLVQLRYLTPIPTHEFSASGHGADVRDGLAGRIRMSPLGARHDDMGAQVAALWGTIDAVAHRLDILPSFNIDDVMRGLAADATASLVVADSEFSNGAARLSDLAQLVPVAKNGIYTPDLVDESVTLRPGNPRPRYPESLQVAGVEAVVNVRFVVDSTGKVDEPTIEFRPRVQQLFMDAIRASLRRARFFPARFAGAVVPQLVQQEFRFELRDRP